MPPMPAATLADAFNSAMATDRPQHGDSFASVGAISRAGG